MAGCSYCCISGNVAQNISLFINASPVQLKQWTELGVINIAKSGVERVERKKCVR